jgi:PAS domain S-box-containing protein
MNPPKPQILVVEDERLIAHSIQRALISAGYEVSGICSSAPGAISILESHHTDLVLMDIRIQGDLDGVDTATLINDRFHLPVIYLTAHADEPTLKRAKVTMPFGYLMKPVNYGQLQSSIEVALHKHKLERQLEEHRALLASILKSIPEAVLVTGPEGRVNFMNKAAERLTEWEQSAAAGLEIGEVAPLMSSSGTMKSLVHRALSEKRTVQLPRETQLSARLGREVPVEGNIAPITAGSRSAGSVITLQDATLKLREEQQIRQEHNMLVLGQFAGNLSGDFYSLLRLISDCAGDLITNGKQKPDDLEAITTIAHASKAAASLAEQLNELGRQGALRPESVSLNDAVSGLQPLLAKLAGDSVRLEYALHPATGNVFIHPNQMDQLLIHLVLNAKHSMASSTGQIVVSTSSGCLRQENQGFVKLLVHARPDDASIRLNLRPDFLMADPEVSFTIVKAIVAVAGGFSVGNEEPSGALVTEVHLPQSTSEAARKATRPSRTTIMTVGLDLELAEFIHRQLEDDQFLVLEAPGVSEARLISELYDSHIDISVIDIDLVSDRSREGLQIALLARFPNTKFIYIADSKTTLRKAGSEHVVLAKPFSLGSLSRAIENILGNATAAMHA